MASELEAIIRGQGTCGTFQYMLTLHLNVPLSKDGLNWKNIVQIYSKVSKKVKNYMCT